MSPNMRLGFWMLEKWLLICGAFAVLISLFGLVEAVVHRALPALITLPVAWAAAAGLYGLSRLIRSTRPKFDNGRTMPIGEAIWRRR